VPPHVVSAARGSSSRPAWDQLTEQERRALLDAMDPADVRSLAVTMPAIEQAKGVVMGCYGGDAASAFALLHRVSSSTNVKLRDLAVAVVEAASHGPSDGSASSPREQVDRVLGVGQVDPEGPSEGR
jgi:hypothetical protein